MTPITAYETSDGRIFKEQEKAVTHQVILDLKTAITNLLGGRDSDICPNSSSFANGDGYYQLSEENYQSALCLIDTLKELAGMPTNYSITSVYCRDNDITCSIGVLMSCIDETTLRRYGQPYYRIHPNKCTSQKDWSIKG